MFRNEKKILFLDAGNFEKKSITLKKSVKEGIKDRGVITIWQNCRRTQMSSLMC